MTPLLLPDCTDNIGRISMDDIYSPTPHTRNAWGVGLVDYASQCNSNVKSYSWALSWYWGNVSTINPVPKPRMP